MTDQPSSGSRWEPTAPDRAAHRASAAPASGPGPAPAQQSPSGTGLPSAPDPRSRGYPEAAWHQGPSHEVRRPGRRAWLAGLAAALLLGGSAGGYTVGHRSADVPTPGVGFPDGTRPGNGAPGRDGLGSRSDDSGEGLARGDAHDTGFGAEGGNAG